MLTTYRVSTGCPKNGVQTTYYLIEDVYMYMKKIWKKCFRQKNQLFLLLLLTIIQFKQRYIRTSLP
jgi:hypothetical protein